MASSRSVRTTTLSAGTENADGSYELQIDEIDAFRLPLVSRANT